MIKEVEKNKSVLGRDMKGIKKARVAHRVKKTAMSGKKRAGWRNKLDATEEKMSELEDLAIETLQNEAQRGKKP